MEKTPHMTPPTASLIFCLIPEKLLPNISPVMYNITQPIMKFSMKSISPYTINFLSNHSALRSVLCSALLWPKCRHQRR